ncbi:MAG: hypothetical protein NZ561_03780, partial [Phycisphaerae bacterium]|nr:hypothetical protein [Phycisphaerae bacterium]
TSQNVSISISSSGSNFRVTDASDGSSQDFLRLLVLRFVLVGSNGNDRLSIGTDITLPATLQGGAGNDALSGGGGNDVLIGEAGADELAGNGGSDTASYATRTEPLVLSADGSADDGAANEKDNIATDIEQLAGGSGNDSITGSDGNNVLLGNGGKDTLRGSGGNDTLSGGNGNDLLDGQSGSDFLVGSAGAIDTVDYSARLLGVSVTIDDLPNDGTLGELDNIAATCEGFVGGLGSDSIVGSGKPNRIDGGSGSDTLRGGGGNDTILGGSGIDSILGEGGNDSLFSRDLELDSVSGGSGTDTAETDVVDIVSGVP